jgi:hypothetical protein
MQPKNLISRTNARDYGKDTHGLSRREFLKIALVASGGLGLWLSGCSPGTEQTVEKEEPLAVVDEWIRMLNAKDVAGFEKLHTESVFATNHYRTDPSSGREQIWDVFSKSTGSQLERITAFGLDQSVCLLVNATKFNRSLCYVFNFVNGVIDRVYEYLSGRYDLSNSSHFLSIEISGDDSALQDRLDAMDDMFVHAVNNGDISVPHVTESTINFVATSREPIIGRSPWTEGDYSAVFPSVSHKKIQTFGQGDLVCTHIMVEGAPKGSLCWVARFQDGRIAQLYEFWSDAKVDERT